MIDFRWLMGTAIRERDDEQRLIEAGYRWNELSKDSVMAGAFLLFVAFYVCFMSFDFGPAELIPCGYVAYVYAEIITWLVGSRRTVIFHRNGSVSTPFGQPGKLGLRKLRINHASIASIEMTGECHGMGVAVYTVEGETIIVGHYLKTKDARQVAVQLTKALHELRDSIATVDSTRSAFYAQVAAA